MMFLVNKNVTGAGMPKRVKWVDVQCAACGEPLRRRETDLARLKTGRVFCSSGCRNAAGSKPRRRDERDCAGCGEKFYPTSSADQRFCSRRCHSLSQRRYPEGRPCVGCGETHFDPTGVYCSRECYESSRAKNPLDRYHNGRPVIVDGGGYVRIYEPDHPRAFKSGRVLEHRWVVEQIIGRYLETDEHVHHIDHVRTNNDPSNLQLLSARDHLSITARENGDAIREAVEARQKLQEYERRYGPL